MQPFYFISTSLKFAKKNIILAHLHKQDLEVFTTLVTFPDGHMKLMGSKVHVYKTGFSAISEEGLATTGVFWFYCVASFVQHLFCGLL